MPDPRRANGDGVSRKAAVRDSIRRLEAEMGLSTGPVSLAALGAHAEVASARRLAVAAVNRPENRMEEDRRFLETLCSGEAAVRAGMGLEWSDGPVEGHVNRVKAIKRTMSGRAEFDLLKARVLHAG